LDKEVTALLTLDKQAVEALVDQEVALFVMALSMVVVAVVKELAQKAQYELFGQVLQE
jgi:hypothetical protein